MIKYCHLNECLINKNNYKTGYIYHTSYLCSKIKILTYSLYTILMTPCESNSVWRSIVLDVQLSWEKKHSLWWMNSASQFGYTYCRLKGILLFVNLVLLCWRSLQSSWLNSSSRQVKSKVSLYLLIVKFSFSWLAEYVRLWAAIKDGYMKEGLFRVALLWFWGYFSQFWQYWVSLLIFQFYYVD